MATRTKTIKYAFPILVSTTDGTLTNFTAINVYIPETVVAFKSCFIEFGSQDIVTATGGTITEWRVGFRLGAAGYTTVTELNDLTHSGEELATMFLVDMTAHFTTNWTGTSMNADCQVYIDQSTGTTLGQRNLSAVLTITYEYNDAAATHIKTVQIPLDGGLTNMNMTTLTEIGTNQVPALDTLLPETSKVYRDIYFVMDVNEANGAGAVDGTLGLQLDSEAETVFGTTERALGSDRFVRFVWKRTDMTTNAVHAFKARVNGLVGFYHPSITLVVTYEFAASSTEAMVSVQLPFSMVSPVGGVVATEALRSKVELWVEETGPIAIKHSATKLTYTTLAAIAGLNVRTNKTGSTAKAYEAFSSNEANPCGVGILQQRFDSAVTLARGKNVLDVEVYRTDATDLGWAFTGMLLINYTCTVPSGGHGSLNHTLEKLLVGTNGVAAAGLRNVGSQVFVNIPETNWFSTSSGFVYHAMTSNTGGISGVAVVAKHDGSIGWEKVYADAVIARAEVGEYIFHGTTTQMFDRWNGDPGALRDNPETSRPWAIQVSPTLAFHSLVGMFTYHTITFTVSGTVSGYADADGAGLTINIHRDSDGELLGTVTTTAGGNFTFTWYDNTENLFTECYEDSTHVGRSLPGVAV